MSKRSNRTTVVLFLVVSVISGGNGVGVRFSNRELDPMWGATLRFALSSLVLFAIVVVLREKLPARRGLVGAAVYGLFAFGGGFAFAYYGLVKIQAGLGQTLLALAPLFTILLAAAQRQERIRTAAIGGSLVAAVGIAIISGGAVRGDLLSILAMLGAAACFGQAAIVARKYSEVAPVPLNAIGMAAGSALLLLLSLITRESIQLPRLGVTWAAIAFLVLVGSVVVFVVYVMIIQDWGASRAAYTFVLIPISTVLLSVWLDDESVGTELLIGGALVILAVYFGALRPAHLDSASRTE